MIKAHLDNKSAVPAWAAIGVPLIGVPLMVVLLALAVPTEPSVDHDAVVRTEQVDLKGVGQQIDVGVEEVEEPARRG